MMSKTAVALVSLVKTSVFIALGTMVFSSAFAWHSSYYGSRDEIYLGNPTRPNTIWVPAHCEKGCWKEGYYVKFLTPPTCRDVAWVDGAYDRDGNWIQAHWKVRGARVVGSY